MCNLFLILINNTWPLGLGSQKEKKRKKDEHDVNRAKDFGYE